MDALDDRWLDDPVRGCVEIMTDEEFDTMLGAALTKDLDPSDLHPAKGFACFWGAPVVEV